MRLFFLLLCMGFGFSAVSAQEGGQTLIFWHHYADESRAEFWENRVQEFNATNPAGISVTVQYYPAYLNQHDAILSGLINGQTPNIALVRNFHAALYQLSGALVDLNGVVEINNLPEIFAEQDVVNRQRLGVPMVRSYEAVYVNRDLLGELGYEALPQNRAEWGEMACAYAENSGYTTVGFEIPLSASFWLALDYPREIYDGRRFAVDLSETIEFLQDLLTKRCVSLNIGTVADAQNRFASGQTLFYVDASSAEPYVAQAVSSFFAVPFALDIMPIPAREGWVRNVYGASLVMFDKGVAQNEAAAMFIEWLTQPEQVDAWAAANASFSVWDFPDDAALMTEPNMAGYDVIRDEIVFAVRDILSGGVEMTTRLQDLNEMMNAINRAFNE